MKKLLEALESATNVKSVTYDNDTKEWTIIYNNGEPDTMKSEYLIDWLNNA